MHESFIRKRVTTSFLDEFGNPTFQHTEIVQKQSVLPLIQRALAFMYHPTELDSDYDKDRFANMTNVEVGAIRYAEQFATGDPKHVEAVLDRLIGKPKQQTENINVNVPIQDYLATIPDRIHTLLPEHRFTLIKDVTVTPALQTLKNENYDV